MLKKLLSTQTLYNPVTDSVSLSIKKMLHKASWETVITLILFYRYKYICQTLRPAQYIQRKIGQTDDFLSNIQQLFFNS